MKNNTSKAEILLDLGLVDDQAVVADGFDKCIIGATSDGRVVYDHAKMIKLLMKQGKMNADEACEYFDYNIGGAYIENGPVYIVKL